MKQGPFVAVECLEERRLLSATVVNPGGPVIPAPTPTPTPPPISIIAGHGVTLNLKASQPFAGYLGDLTGVSKQIEQQLSIAASINWGDGTAPSAGTITIGTSGAVDVGGAHTYARAGQFAITITVTGAPVGVPGQPIPELIALLGTIRSRAVVSSATSSGGVTLHEKAGVKFSASVGTFVAIAPATGLEASIDWGDGKTSLGTLKPDGIIGVDQIKFEVDGTHTYAKAGTYAIQATVVRPGPTPTSPTVLIATINSTAIVQAVSHYVLLDGKITGTYTPAPAVPDIGATYVFTGAGTAGVMGAVTASGTVYLPGFVTSGHATGTLTLTTANASKAKSGSVTLQLTGPTQKGFSTTVPSKLQFVITGGTGEFANAAGSGTIAVKLGAKRGFSFLITSIPPVPTN